MIVRTCCALLLTALITIVTASEPAEPLVRTVTVPPAFDIDFGVVRPGQVLKLIVTSPCGIKSGSVAGGNWQGGPTEFTSVVPTGEAGEHQGRFTGRYIPCPGGSGTVDPVWSGLAKAKSVTVVITTMTSPHRLGLTTMSHNRIQHHQAQVTPASEAANVTITASDERLTISNSRVEGGIVHFDLDGNYPSETEGDSAVIASHSVLGEMDRETVSAIVPAAIAAPHPQHPRAAVAGTNVLLDAGSSPAWGGQLGQGQVVLATTFVVPLTVTVHDQFGQPCGDLYAGSAITENGPHPINQTLTAASTFTDPVGVIMTDSRPVARNSPQAIAWPTQPPQSQANPYHDLQNIDVRVDGFPLDPGIADRTVNGFPPDQIEVIWP